MIALLGRRDMPTDGVEDYCTFLGRALAVRGVELRPVRVPWLKQGWLGALRGLWRDAAAWRGQWVLLQYTALSWSRRGFPFGALAVLSVLRVRGVRCAVVFHEPWCQGQAPGWLGRVRGACQDWVIHRLYRGAAKAIFTSPLENIPWLPKDVAKSAFIPIGGSIPERVNRRGGSAAEGRKKNVIVFGVTGAPTMAREVEEISAVLRDACATLGGLRLVVIGRGAMEARADLARALANCDVELTVRGVLPAEEISREFERADALLFVRGAIAPQRSSAMAGIACGVPIVGYQNGDISGPLKEAGIEWSPWQDRDSLTRGLVRVLSDGSRWLELHERNLKVQQEYFSWTRIAERYQMVVTE
jgi:glycosyltransferase involved in cell wall biosynthesis